MKTYPDIRFIHLHPIHFHHCEPLLRKPRTSFSAYDTNLLSKPFDDPLSTQSRKDLLNDIEHDRDFEKTNYFLVIDGISPEHPVWLIYDRNCLNMVGEMEPVNPSKELVVFPEIKVNFDAAMILLKTKHHAFQTRIISEYYDLVFSTSSV